MSEGIRRNGQDNEIKGIMYMLQIVPGVIINTRSASVEHDEDINRVNKVLYSLILLEQLQK